MDTLTITSPNNEKVKHARSLQKRRMREKEGRFLAEGVRVVEDALRAGWVPALVFFTADVAEENPRAAALVEQATLVAEETYSVHSSIMKLLSDTVSPQGIVAVMALRSLPPSGDSLLLVVDGVQDPGNLGTLLRSAEAAGVDRVLLAPGTVDAFSPKVVRAGAGAQFRLPIDRLSWPDIRRALRGKHVRLADEGSATAYHEADWRAQSALIVGNEGAGPSDEARRLAGERIAVPMAGGTESLNVAVAASVILFEAARQRRSA